MMSSIFGVNLGRGARFEAVTVVLLRIQVFWDVMCCWLSASWCFQGTLILLNMGTILSMTRHHFPENLNLCQQMVNRIVPLCSQRANAGKHSIQASILVAQFSIYEFCVKCFGDASSYNDLTIFWKHWHFQFCHHHNSELSTVILVNFQLDAQNSYLFVHNTFIKILYRFWALPCSSSGGLRRNCMYAASGIVTLCRWLSCAPVKKELNM